MYSVRLPRKSRHADSGSARFSVLICLRAPVAGMSNASVSAIRAGFSDPSTSSVFWVFMITCPPSLGSTPDEDDAQPHARAGRHGRKKAHLVDPVVEARRRVLGNDADLHCQAGDHGKRQIAMGNRAAEWAFPLCALDVDMDPLMIAGARRKRIDARLIDRRPNRKRRAPVRPVRSSRQV